MAITIAAHNGDINVHANNAYSGLSAAYLALALQKRPTPPYYHYVPGCNSSRSGFVSFLSVVSVYDSTDVDVIKYSHVIGGPSRRLHFRTMQVQSNVKLQKYQLATVCTSCVNKKLSCRRETARRFVPLDILLSHSSSLKVIRNDTVE